MVVKFKLCQDAFAVAMTVTHLCLSVTIMRRAPGFPVCSPERQQCLRESPYCYPVMMDPRAFVSFRERYELIMDVTLS